MRHGQRDVQERGHGKGGASIQGYIIELSGVEVLVSPRTALSNEAMRENAARSAARAAG